MKIALVCDWYHPRIGGIERHLQDLSCRLTSAGHDVVVVTPTPGNPTVDGIRVVRVAAALAPRFEFLVTPGGIRSLGDAVAAERPDVVHVHVSIVSPAALGAARDAARRRLPLVLTFHSVVPNMRTLSRLAGSALGAAEWNAQLSAVSRRVARDVAPFAPARPIRILPNGIDASFWRCDEHANGDGITRLISVMRLNPKKRPLALVEMMRRVRDRTGRDQRVELTIVGDGPSRSRVEREVARLGLADVIVLAGNLSREGVRELLARSDLFVLPTIRESFGLAALEARAAGLPVVARRASGVAELIEHGVNGLLADSDDDLVAHVLQLVQNRELRAAISLTNRSTTPPCDWSVVLDAHLSVYRDAVGARSELAHELAHSHE